eukprot:gene2951-5796_t
MDCESHTFLTYVTDIEGNWDYWNRFIGISRIVSRDSNTSTILIKNNCHLIFGGDATDRGPGDIRILNDLLQLQRDFPNNVHFISGNRDLNKLRLPFELNCPNLLKKNPRVYWIPDDVKNELCEHSRSDRIKWMLAKTMGSPEAFEYRRQELLELGKPSDDDAVVDSYLDLVKPGGILTEFLLKSNLCKIFGGLVSFTTLSPKVVQAALPLKVGAVICIYDWTPADVLSKDGDDEGSKAKMMSHRFFAIGWRSTGKTLNMMCSKTDIQSMKHQLEALGSLRPKIAAPKPIMSYPVAESSSTTSTSTSSNAIEIAGVTVADTTGEVVKLETAL